MKVQIMKHEWHQVDSQFLAEVDEITLMEIYPDYSPEEIHRVMRELARGEYDIDLLMSDAWDANFDLEWEREYDDWWTDRKGGYEVTYEYQDEPVDVPEPDEDEFPPMDPDELAQRLNELKIEFDFMTELEYFKNDESIHQEIRDAFVKIINEEDMGV